MGRDSATFKSSAKPVLKRHCLPVPNLRGTKTPTNANQSWGHCTIAEQPRPEPKALTKKVENFDSITALKRKNIVLDGQTKARPQCHHLYQITKFPKRWICSTSGANFPPPSRIVSPCLKRKTARLSLTPRIITFTAGSSGFGYSGIAQCPLPSVQTR